MPRAAGASYPVLEKKCHCQALWEVPSVWWVPPFLLLTHLPTRAPGRLCCAGAFRGPLGTGTAGTSGPLAAEGRAQVPDGPRLGRLPGPAWRPKDSASAPGELGGAWGWRPAAGRVPEGPGSPSPAGAPGCGHGHQRAPEARGRLPRNLEGGGGLLPGTGLPGHRGGGSGGGTAPWSCSAPERIKGEKALG